jgi:hypothetical protein
MKNIIISKNSLLPLMAAILILTWTSCKVDVVNDPNNPGAGTISVNASLSELQNLVDGIESGMRDNLGNYFDGVGVIGREFYRYSTSDPRFTSDLLGKGSATLDGNTFYTTNPFASRYRVIKNTNILIKAFQNTKATITDAQRRAGIAYAMTIQAYQLLMVLNEQYGNGVRVDVSDPDKLGPFLTKDASLNAIQDSLDKANLDLKGNSATLPFTTSLYSNVAGDFSKLNRAFAARVAVYRQDWALANTALSESFFNMTGDLNTGSWHLFSTAGGDQLNPQYFPLNSSGETRVVEPSFITDAAAGDKRVTAKTSKRTATAFQDGLQSDYDFWVYQTNVAPIALIRNEELILIYAETQAQLSNPVNAKNAINVIRSAAGLSGYSGPTDLNNLIDEILDQRRYSLFGEGHRWIDMRRYNKLDQLPLARPNDHVWTQFPRPATE